MPKKDTGFPIMEPVSTPFRTGSRKSGTTLTEIRPVLRFLDSVQPGLGLVPLKWIGYPVLLSPTMASYYPQLEDMTRKLM